MERTTIGSLEVSVIGLGTNNFGTNFFGKGCGQNEVTRIVSAAFDAGVNLIDTAEEYSISSFLGEGHSEELLGIALTGRRDEAVIATKWLPWNERDPTEKGAARIVAAAEASLRRLRTDHIDLWQQHQPDADTPIDEILEANDRLLRGGKVREIGCCNFDGGMLDAVTRAASHTGLPPYRTCQLQYNLLERPDPDVVEALARNGVTVLAYFPLASGLLTGKYRRGQPPPPGSRLGSDAMVSAMLRDGIMARRPPLSDERLDTVERLRTFAADRHRPLLELALSWLVSQQHVGAVITGATTPDQIITNAAAAQWHLDAGELAAIDAIVAAEE